MSRQTILPDCMQGPSEPCHAFTHIQELLDSTSNMLRGMCLDGAIPRHAKDAMKAKIAQIDGCLSSIEAEQ